MSDHKILDFPIPPDPEEMLPHFNASALCLECVNTWIATIPVTASLFGLECPYCGACKSYAAVFPQDFENARMELFKNLGKDT